MKVVAELTTRLRQLDYVVRAGRLSFDVADQRYGQIIGELHVEHAILAPTDGGSSPSASR